MVIASVIIPSYQRKDLLKLSLLSFNYQTFPGNKYEVIVIDDGSKDGTHMMVKELKQNFNLRYFRLSKNKGAATARNIGIKKANGDIIIFSDSDCIVPNNFVEDHVNKHLERANIALCGVIRWKKIFSKYYDDFNHKQKKEFEKVRTENRQFEDRLRTINFNYQDDINLIFSNDINDIEKFSFIPDWGDIFFKQLNDIYGLDLKGFKFPWYFFGTGNSSLHKDNLKQVGLFDERLSRVEDWDLGYRLYKYDLNFVCNLNIESMHQEHIISSDLDKKVNESYKILFNKHNGLDILIMPLNFDSSIDLFTLSQGLKEYKEFIEPDNKFQNIVSKFKQRLKYRTNNFLEGNVKQEKYLDIRREIQLLQPIRNKVKSFIKIYTELSRIY